MQLLFRLPALVGRALRASRSLRLCGSHGVLAPPTGPLSRGDHSTSYPALSSSAVSREFPNHIAIVRSPQDALLRVRAGKGGCTTPRLHTPSALAPPWEHGQLARARRRPGQLARARTTPGQLPVLPMPPHAPSSSLDNAATLFPNPLRPRPPTPLPPPDAPSRRARFASPLFCNYVNHSHSLSFFPIFPPMNAAIHRSLRAAAGIPSGAALGIPRRLPARRGKATPDRRPACVFA